MKGMKLLGAFLAVMTSVVGCTAIPRGLEPVAGFDLDRYLGTWYEIARLDHAFERNLTHVSAEYTRSPDGTVRVTNRGYNPEKGEWRSIEGRAKFIGKDDIGSLKVSFFGPFYGGYHVIALDRENYRYAVVAGPSRSYLWILSRSKTMDEALYQTLVSQADTLGFDTSTLIRVKQQ